MRTTLTSILALALFAGTPNAALVPVTASHNASVNKNSPTTDHDESEVIRAKSMGGDRHTWFSYLRFDVSGLTHVKDTTPASLNLYLVNPVSSATLSVVVLDDGISGEPTWDSSLTYSTRPDGTSGLPNGNTSGSLASTSVSGSPRVVSLDLTGHLDDLLEADTNGEITFILYTNNNYVPQFSSLDNTGGHPVPTLQADIVAGTVLIFR